MNLPVVDWNWAAASSLYSQLTGVLAGFAFTAIILLINKFENKRQSDKIAQATCTLLIVLVGLIMASFLFAFLAGYTNKGQASSQIMDIIGNIASFIFAICMIQMFMGLVLLFKSYSFPREVISMSKTAFLVASFLAQFYMIATIAESAILQQSDYEPFSLVMIPPILIAIIYLVVRLFKYQLLSSRLKNKYYEFLSMILVLFIFAGIFFEVISYVEYILPLWQFLTLSYFLLLIQGVIFLLSDYFISGAAVNSEK